MTKEARQLDEQHYPELQLVEPEIKTRRERLMEAYERLGKGMEVVIEKRKSKPPSE